MGVRAVFKDRQSALAALSLCISVQCALVVALGYKHGDRTVDRPSRRCGDSPIATAQLEA